MIKQEIYFKKESQCTDTPNSGILKVDLLQ
jgi:hypothetical protein